MPSAFATMFQAAARPMLWRIHSEVVQYLDSDSSTREVRVIWRRIKPDSEDADGLGLTSYRAQAIAVVRAEDLPEPHGAAEIERAGERWAIRLIELQDEWTWKLHLAQPIDITQLPERLR